MDEKQATSSTRRVFRLCHKVWPNFDFVLDGPFKFCCPSWKLVMLEERTLQRGRLDQCSHHPRARGQGLNTNPGGDEQGRNIQPGLLHRLEPLILTHWGPLCRSYKAWAEWENRPGHHLGPHSTPGRDVGGPRHGQKGTQDPRGNSGTSVGISKSNCLNPISASLLSCVRRSWKKKCLLLSEGSTDERERTATQTEIAWGISGSLITVLMSWR